MPTALVTGATGMVGSHIVERLHTQGWSVRALVRDGDTRSGTGTGSSAMLAWLRARGVELAIGNILDQPTFTRAAQGCDAIFHAAAVIIPSSRAVRAYDAYRIPNVDGTRNAISAAERSGARLLQLSSVAVYGPESRYDLAAAGNRVDEESPLRPLPARAFYARSKRESEEIVMHAHSEGRIWATAVRPDVIYGPRDRQFVPRIARLLRYGVGPVVAGGRSTLAIVHAANVADGAVLAATHPDAGGRAYNLANDFDVTVAEFYRLAGEGLGRRVRIVSIPLWVARAGLQASKRMLNLVTGSRMSVVSTASLDFVTRDNPFSSDRARRELGWSPRVRPEQGVPEAFRWWRERQIA